MSLINQMLQELDARHADGAGSTSYGQQVRTVPERQRRIHPAWWVALILGAALLSVTGWLLFRPSPKIAPVPAGAMAASKPTLPLKMDAEIGSGNLPPAASPQRDGQTAVAVPSDGKAPSIPAVSAGADATVGTAGAAGTAASTSSNAPGLPAAAPVPVQSTSAALPRQSSLTSSTQVKTPAAPDKTSSRSPETLAAESTGAAGQRGQAVAEPTKKERSAPQPAPAASVGTSPSLPASVAAGNEQRDAGAPSAGPKQVKEPSPQQRAENEYRKALVAIEQGKVGEGISGLETALQFDGRHAAARQSLIGLLLNARRQEEAIRHAREGLALDDAQPGLAMILARLQLEKGALKDSIEVLERTLPHARERADYLAFLAALLQRDERHKQAVDFYIQALQRSPQNGVWWMGLGISLQADQKTAEAFEAFKRAKSTNSLTPELAAFVNGRLSQLQR